MRIFDWELFMSMRKIPKSDRRSYSIFFHKRLEARQWLEFILKTILSIVINTVCYWIFGSKSFTQLVEQPSNMLIPVMTGIIISVLWYKVHDIQILGKKFKRNKLLDNLLKDSISKIIEAVKSNSKMQERYMFSLVEIVNSNTNPLYFDPDYPLIDLSFSWKGALSITEASPAAWTDPTYNYFLLCQYISNVKKKIGNKKVKVSLKARNDESFKSHFRHGKKILGKLRNIEDCCALKEILENVNIRFYLMSEESLKRNKGIVEYLVAGHELAGIHLYIINSNINMAVDNSKIYEALFYEENSIFDVALMYTRQGVIEYAKREAERISNVILQEDAETPVIEYIRSLASLLYADMKNENPQYLIYPISNGELRCPNVNFKLNQHNCYLNVSSWHKKRS